MMRGAHCDVYTAILELQTSHSYVTRVGGEVCASGLGIAQKIVQLKGCLALTFDMG